MSKFQQGNVKLDSGKNITFGDATTQDTAAADPLTTKGDIFVYGTDNTRLPVGTDDYVLTADSTEATGLKWAAGGGGSSDKIEEGDTSVECVDAGTGYISITADSNERFRIKSAVPYMTGGQDIDSPQYSEAIYLGQMDGSVRPRFALIESHGTDNMEGQYIMGRSRGSLTSKTAVQSGDRIGSLNFTGYDGSGWKYSCGIFCKVDGSVSTNTVPMRLEFHTSTTWEASRAARFVVESDGDCRPGADDTHDLGTASYRWDDIYATNTTIQSSDERLKTDILDTNLGLDFINDLRPVSYKWKDYTSTVICETDDGEKHEHEIEHKHTRDHQGLIAQEVLSALTKAGVTTEQFAGITYDDDSDRYGLRYSEFIGPMIKAIQELTARVEDLEAQLN